MRRVVISITGAVALLLAWAIGGYSSYRVEAAQAAPVLSCAGPLQPYLRTSLYMDRSDPKAPSGRITNDEWQRFVDDTLLEHFPAGGTVFANTGWWRRPNGTTGGGVGMTLVVLAPGSEATLHRKAAQAVIEKFKKRYSQRSVLWEEDQVCAAF